MKLSDFVGKNAKFWELLTKLGKFWLIFTKTRFSQNYACADFLHKNEAMKLKLGLEVPLYDF